MADGVGGTREVSESEKESKLMEWFKSGPKLMDVSSFTRTDGRGALELGEDFRKYEKENGRMD